MHTHETIEAVLHTLLDPDADVIESAHQLGLSLTEFLAIAESPQVTQAIEALERIALIRTRAILARSAHSAIAALERIADGDPQTPGAVETCRKAAAQILREAARAAAPDAEAPRSPAPPSNLPPPTDEDRSSGAEHSAVSEDPSPRTTDTEPRGQHPTRSPQPRARSTEHFSPPYTAPIGPAHPGGRHANLPR